MNRQEVDKQYNAFWQAYGRTLFAVDREKKYLLKQKRDSLLAQKQMFSEQKVSVQSNIQQKCRKLVCQLKTQLSDDIAPVQGILKCAEYLSVGHVSFQNLGADTSVPYILPFIGHKNLILSSQGDGSDVLRDILFHVLEQTAPGQIQIYIYNPKLKNSFSCFSELEEYFFLSTKEAFSNEMDKLAKEIVTTDTVLKGKYNSLIEFRKMSKQAVGQLRLYIVADSDWTENETLRKKVLELSESAIRAGSVFVFNMEGKAMTKAQDLLKTSCWLKQTPKGNWIHTKIADLEVQLDKFPLEQTEGFIKDYILQSKETSVVTIPFDSMEDVQRGWSESSAEGITFNLGKFGLDTVSLRLGDEKTQLHNVLITGAPGKGKSNLLEIIIHSMCCRYSPDELELYLLDFKDGLTFKPYSYSQQFSWLPHAKVLGLESSRDFGVAVLEHVEKERKERALVMHSVDARSLDVYRKKKPDAIMPRIVILIDEYQKFVEIDDELGKRAEELIENIVRQGRACGIHLILASQTVAYGGALSGHEDKIYPAFPVRIALQNSLQESYATFAQGNDAAAKLRVRGEAVLNVNYGAIDSNQKFSVAFADPEAMLKLRKKWCAIEPYNTRIPKVLSKQDAFHLFALIPCIKKWRENVLTSDMPPMLPCGQLISVKEEVIAVKMSKNGGRNVAILGSGDGEQQDVNKAPLNYAVGLLEGMALSLALQYPNGNARFYFINGMEPSTSIQNGVPLWLKLMERFGYPVETVSIKDAAQFFVQLSDELKSSAEPEEERYILALAMDRCTNLGESVGTDMFNTVTGIDAFREVLKNGPAKGIHILAWWSNVAVYQDHIGYNCSGYIDTKILLRLDDATSKSILGPFVQWNGPYHRALVHDVTELQENKITIPMTPCTQRDTGKIEAVIWE